MVRNNIFYATTPYHILLSLSIAVESLESEDYLLIAPTFSKSDEIVNSLCRYNDIPFTKVQTLTPMYGKTLPQKYILKSQQSIQCRRLVRELNPDRIYVARDAGAAEQSLLHHASSDTTKIYIEDGTAAYSGARRSPKPVWKRFAGKLFYGPWWTPPQVFGTSRWIDRIAVTFPDHVRPELIGYPIDSISSTSLQSINSDWIESYFSTVGVNPATLADINCVIITTHSEVAENNSHYSKSLREEIDNASEKVAVKYHPRETEGDYLGVAERENVTIVPQSIPAELIYLYADRLATVIGTISTALLTARWIDDDLEVISLAEVLKIGDEQLKSTFQSVGIEVR